MAARRWHCRPGWRRGIVPRCAHGGRPWRSPRVTIAMTVAMSVAREGGHESQRHRSCNGLRASTAALLTRSCRMLHRRTAAPANQWRAACVLYRTRPSSPSRGRPARVRDDARARFARFARLPSCPCEITAGWQRCSWRCQPRGRKQRPTFNPWTYPPRSQAMQNSTALPRSTTSRFLHRTMRTATATLR